MQIPWLLSQKPQTVLAEEAWLVLDMAIDGLHYSGNATEGPEEKNGPRPTSKVVELLKTSGERKWDLSHRREKGVCPWPWEVTNQKEVSTTAILPGIVIRWLLSACGAKQASGCCGQDRQGTKCGPCPPPFQQQTEFDVKNNAIRTEEREGHSKWVLRAFCVPFCFSLGGMVPEVQWPRYALCTHFRWGAVLIPQLGWMNQERW